ncbi:ATP-dependent DNA helicase [uncultured Microbacterium sp.]|uniref:ATP-dependent DNA helicase n=1 Tax=uncultured Microbacterium sp. TaxID=191216 RepID=UPI0025F9881E|nr:ATP-dependent DNA helicase [uncultured Microbacterium sp.]
MDRVTWDAAQRAVIDLPADASGVVVGAPGSGKTATAIARVGALVRPPAGHTRGALLPDEVLVLTPSRTSATALRDRLALAVGVATPGALARSIVAFAYQIIRADAVHRGDPAPQLLTGPDEDQVIADLLAGDCEDEAEGFTRWPSSLPAAVRSTRAFRAELRALLAECAQLGISPDGLSDLAAQHGVAEWAAAASFSREYLYARDRMRGAHRDAAGLVREALGLLRTLPAGAPGLAALERLRAIVVDDAQELTLGGVELLEACRSRGVAVLAFGDPDVGSGSFRGASPENFSRLAAAGPVHVLERMHRGTDAHRRLIAAVTARIGAAGLVAHRLRPPTASDAPTVDDESVRAVTARSASEEHDVIARLLRERHVHDAVPWSSCAVIAHDSRQVATLEAELAAREVPTRTRGQRPLAEARAVADLLRIALLAELDPAGWSLEDAVDALRAGGMDPVEIRRLRTALRLSALAAEPPAEAASDERVVSSAELLVSALGHPVAFALLDTREGRRAERIARTLADVRAHWDLVHAGGAQAPTAHEILWSAWDGLGAERSWVAAAEGSGPLAAQAGRELDALVALFQAAKRHGERADGTSPGAFLRGILESDVAEDRLVDDSRADAVDILTPAGALGAEYDTVVVAGVQEGVWPNLRARGSLLQTWRLAPLALGGSETADTLDRRRGVLHDELRLFARACSRARRRLIVTAVDDDDTGPSPLFEMLPQAQPAARSAAHPLTLRGLVAQHRRALTERRADPSTRRAAAEQLRLLAAAGVPGAAPDEWYGIAPVTSTAPLRDLTREDVRVSPSRLQTVEECELNWLLADLGADDGGAVAGLGTLVHAAMERATGSDEDALWAVVDARWSELEFESAWRERSERVRARELVRRLSLYLRRFELAGGTVIGAEPHFEVPVALDPAGGHGAIVSGYIDRVERTASGEVVIVDLKTGKREPQTDAKVIDNPQLAAYQLALDAGAIPEAAGLTPGGAKLLVLRPSAATKDYVEPRQPPLDDVARDAFLARVREAATVMSGAEFSAPYEEHCRDDHSYGLCRIHTINAVSAS